LLGRSLGVSARLPRVCDEPCGVRQEHSQLLVLRRMVWDEASADPSEHWLADEPVAAYREPLAVRLARWGRRHKAWVAAAVALLLSHSRGSRRWPGSK
jgi:hypothetical protein